jgi:hypothetical protein
MSTSPHIPHERDGDDYGLDAVRARQAMVRELSGVALEPRRRILVRADSRPRQYCRGGHLACREAYGAKHGWQLKLVAKKRAVAYLIPHDGYFTVAVALRPDAIAELEQSGFSPAQVREVERAMKAKDVPFPGRAPRSRVKEARRGSRGARL